MERVQLTARTSMQGGEIPLGVIASIVKTGKISRKENARFPFDQIFRFEIPGIPCDEWNSIFRFVGLPNPRSSGSKFRAKIRDQTDGSFTFVYLLWGCSTTLKLK